MAKTPQTYLGNDKHKWEHVHSLEQSNGAEVTERLRVPGGWLYRLCVSTARGGTFLTTTFVPLPEVVGKPI